MPTPTQEAYAELQEAYDRFNAELFASQLPPCLITMQRRARTYGYFSRERWNDQMGRISDEIALNPVFFAGRSTEETLSTLVHEMVHLWQHHHGTQQSRRGYHNREWAGIMITIGLQPTDTGEPGGAVTGQHMTHYIIADGPFARVCAQMLADGFTLTWHDRQTEMLTPGPTGKAGIRTRYTCPDCQLRAWAKADALLGCLACNAAMLSDTEWTGVFGANEAAD